MQKVSYDYRYIAALIAVTLIIFGALFDLSGQKQHECAQLDQECEELRRRLNKLRYLFDERDRARQELAAAEAEYEMLQQIADHDEGKQ